MFLFVVPGGRGAMEKRSLFASHRLPKNLQHKKNRSLQTAQRLVLTMNREKIGGITASYLVPERKLGFFVKIKEDENFNHRNTGSISRIKI
jgi:hypothetical protein